MNKRSIKKYVQNKKGITLVSLVVTIVVLIILAGVSISAIFGENGIITIAKQAKENIEQAQIQEQTELNELYTQIQTDIGNSGETSYDVIAEFVEFKKIIAEAITKKGVETKPTDSATTMANNIASIKTEKPTDGTAVASDILSGKTAWVNATKLTGTMKNNGAQTANLNAGSSFVIPEGYHNGSGRITVNSLASQTGATAVAGDILSGKTAWINGNKVTGNMPNIATADGIDTALNSSVYVENGSKGAGFYARMAYGAHVKKSGSGYPELFIPKAMIESGLGAPKVTQIATSNNGSLYANCNVGDIIVIMFNSWLSNPTAGPQWSGLNKICEIGGWRVHHWSGQDGLSMGAFLGVANSTRVGVNYQCWFDGKEGDWNRGYIFKISR